MRLYNKRGNTTSIRQVRDNTGRKALGVVGTMADLEMEGLLNPATASDDVVPYFWYACITTRGKVAVDPDRNTAIRKAIQQEKSNRYDLEEIYTILQQRDGLTRDEAVSLVDETREEMAACEYDPAECEDIVLEMLGLEIDYIPALILT